MEHEQVEQEIARCSARIYLPISVGAALAFFLVTTLSGNYPMVARLGGAAWIGLLSLIVSMPLVISAVKKRYRQGDARQTAGGE